jgi:hypothetical protein
MTTFALEEASLLTEKMKPEAQPPVYYFKIQAAMKKLLFTKTGFLIIALLISIASCEFDSVLLKYGSDQFATYYPTRSDWEQETNKYTGEIVDSGAFHLGYVSDSGHFKFYLSKSFADCRNIRGESNWSDPRMKYTGGTTNNSVTRDAEMATTEFSLEVYPTDNLPTSPVHLHLCLDFWNESSTGVRLGRTWKVATIVDDKGKDLTNDSEWNYYTDNTMRFEKADLFIFTPGALRSAKETELFGTVEEYSDIFGSYSVAGKTPGQVKVTLVFPNFITILTVVESRFGYIKLSGVSDGKKGILELVPID